MKIELWNDTWHGKKPGPGLYCRMTTDVGAVLSRSLTAAEVGRIRVDWVDGVGSWSHGRIRIYTTLDDGTDASVTVDIRHAEESYCVPAVCAFIRAEGEAKEKQIAASNAEDAARRAEEQAAIEARMKRALAGPWSRWVVQHGDPIHPVPGIVTEPVQGWDVHTTAAQAAGAARAHTMRQWIYGDGPQPWQDNPTTTAREGEEKS